MAKVNFRKWLNSVAWWLEGGRAPRRLAAPLVLDRPIEPIEPMAVADLPSIRDLPEQVIMRGQATGRPDRAKIARAFDSAHPVRTRDELFGRARELDALLSATLDFSQHAIIQGARGSGKTSLVRIYGDHADQQGAVVIYMACEPNVSFAELVRPYLQSLPTTALVADERRHFRESLAALPENFGPRAFVDLVSERVKGPVVLVFDEFDRITDAQVKAEVAAAMKLLSDSLTGVLFMLVGIARNVADVIEGHPSLRRHMRVVPLGRIEPNEVKALIDAGELSTGLIFEDEARVVITRASCGSPFHVRMFCHHAATFALARASSTVSGSDTRNGLRTAIEQWAAMNIDDAQHFVSLVEHEALLPEIERIARLAALDDRLPASAGDFPALLGNALMNEKNDADSFVFRDSVAPQFLIAYAILAEAASVS